MYGLGDLVCRPFVDRGIRPCELGQYCQMRLHRHLLVSILGRIHSTTNWSRIVKSKLDPSGRGSGCNPILDHNPNFDMMSYRIQSFGAVERV